MFILLVIFICISNFCMWAVFALLGLTEIGFLPLWTLVMVFGYLFYEAVSNLDEFEWPHYWFLIIFATGMTFYATSQGGHVQLVTVIILI